MKRKPPDAPVYCARCAKATTRVEAARRYFRTTLSACCAENLLDTRPSRPVAPLDVGATDPPWVRNSPPWVQPPYERTE